MHAIRRTLTLAALALAGTLAACAESGTAPKADDDPQVLALNRLANGQGQVRSVKTTERSHAGLPDGRLDTGGLQSLCRIDDGCDPIVRTCYSSCGWFDVAAAVDPVNHDFYKSVNLTGALYAYSGTADASVGIYFYSVGGCSSNPTLFSSSGLDGSGGPFTLSASRYVEYGGQFTWAVYTDGWATNQLGREGYETAYASVCF